MKLPTIQQEIFDELLRYESTDERVIDAWKLAGLLATLTSKVNLLSEKKVDELRCVCGALNVFHTNCYQSEKKAFENIVSKMVEKEEKCYDNALCKCGCQEQPQCCNCHPDSHGWKCECEHHRQPQQIDVCPHCKK